MRSDPNINAERVAQAVFKVLDRRISDGEIQDIKHVLPEDVVELWPKAAQEMGLNAIMESVSRTISPRNLKRLPALRRHERS